MTKAEIWKQLQKYDDSEAIKVKYVRQMLREDSFHDSLPEIEPYWIFIPERIAMLANAIEQTAANPDEKQIGEWTTEINCLCAMLKALDDEKRALK